VVKRLNLVSRLCFRDRPAFFQNSSVKEKKEPVQVAFVVNFYDELIHDILSRK